MTTIYYSQEYNKSMKKLKQSQNEFSKLKEENRLVNQKVEELKDQIIILEEKIQKYKNREMNLEYENPQSVRSMKSEDLNGKLIERNQEIFERFLNEEKKCEELTDDNIRLREINDTQQKKIFSLKLEIKQLKDNSKSFNSNNISDLNNSQMNEYKTKISDLIHENKKVKIVSETYKQKINELIQNFNTDYQNYKTENSNLKDIVKKIKKENEILKQTTDQNLLEINNTKFNNDKGNQLICFRF